jgi:tetratricopeptide (TPR) repeat protein
MLIIKNRAGSYSLSGQIQGSLALSNLVGFALLLALLAGCAPSGPRALLEGKWLIDQGQYPQAIQTLKQATVLFGGTNALAWNYLGVAYQHAGAEAEALMAYQRALALNRDYSEVHFNLGCLWLEQNKIEAAKGEFTAYTLRRPDAVEGFLKLGVTQMRAREPAAAEKSFDEALRLNPQNPEALNGLGLARLQRGRAGEAAQCFASALKQQPGYRPALLNLAIVAHQYLKDRQLALEKYREYMSLKPPPANAEALAATVRQLEQELNPPVRPAATNLAAQPNTNLPKLSAVTPPKPPATNMVRIASTPKPEPAVGVSKPAATSPPKITTASLPRTASAVTSPPPARVEVPKSIAEPVPKRTTDVPKAPTPTSSAAESLISTASVPASATSPKVAKRGFFQRVNPLNLFRAEEKPPMPTTPLGSAPDSPEREATSPVAATATANSPSASAPKPMPGRYTYLSPPEPAPGNRSEAELLFAQGVQARQEHRLPEAIQAYRTAARQDPSLYEAQYNLGLVATEAGNLSLALIAYEHALAIRPTSLDARYNFALVLKQANYSTDAVIELEKLLAIYPNETRAHLALGNLYAQHFGQPAKARQHYLKVIELEPGHSQASAIHFWLAANPP